MEQIDDLFEYVSILLIFINACLYIWSYRNFNKSIALKYFSVYLLISFTIILASTIMAKIPMNNLYLSHYYFISQFILLSLFYRSLFLKKQKKLVVYFLFGILFVLAFKYYLKPSLYFKFNILEIFITSFPIIVYSIIHLYNSLSRKGEYMFINSGILIYLTISTLIFILGDYLSGLNNGTISYIWMINKTLYIVYLVLILVEWKNLQAKNKS